jgi:hypothetical protein
VGTQWLTPQLPRVRCHSLSLLVCKVYEELVALTGIEPVSHYPTQSDQVLSS